MYTDTLYHSMHMYRIALGILQNMYVFVCVTNNCFAQNIYTITRILYWYSTESHGNHRYTESREIYCFYTYLGPLNPHINMCICTIYKQCQIWHPKFDWFCHDYHGFGCQKTTHFCDSFRNQIWSIFKWNILRIFYFGNFSNRLCVQILVNPRIDGILHDLCILHAENTRK